jgi:hypothetical protein
VVAAVAAAAAALSGEVVASSATRLACIPPWPHDAVRHRRGQGADAIDARVLTA